MLIFEEMLTRQTTITKLARSSCLITRPFCNTRSILQQSDSESTRIKAEARPALGHQEENDLQDSIRKGKEEMIKMGFHAPSLWIQNICWGDHDQFQHVNNVHYVRFLESNRMLFADKLAEKLTPERRKDIVTGKGDSFILQSIAVRYRRPVVYPDTVSYCTK
jgi:Thioesterase-like superfamily